MRRSTSLSGRLIHIWAECCPRDWGDIMRSLNRIFKAVIGGMDHVSWVRRYNEWTSILCKTLGLCPSLRLNWLKDQSILSYLALEGALRISAVRKICLRSNLKKSVLWLLEIALGGWINERKRASSQIDVWLWESIWLRCHPLCLGSRWKSWQYLLGKALWIIGNCWKEDWDVALLAVMYDR